MKTLKREFYNTMNSWNNATAPAYNLKIYNVIDKDLQDKVFELMEAENFYDEINCLINDFDEENSYEWQAGFNGRSGGYLVLYKGGKKISEHKSVCAECGQRNFTSVKETGKTCGKCGANARYDREFFEVFTMAGQGIELPEVPAEVLKRFRKLAVDIVKTTEEMARSSEMEEVPTGQTVKMIKNN
jgi:hypothetical protein